MPVDETIGRYRRAGAPPRSAGPVPVGETIGRYPRATATDQSSPAGTGPAVAEGERDGAAVVVNHRSAGTGPAVAEARREGGP